MVNLKPESAYEAVIFDLGGVIVDYRGADGVAALARSAPHLAGFASAWNRMPAFHAFERGEIGPEEFAAAIYADWPLAMSQTEFLTHYGDWVVGLFGGVEPLLAEVAAKMPVACLSNINQVHWDRCLALGVDRFFETQFLSHEMGMRKPEARIYRAAADAMGLAPERMLFLDDMIENVEGARAAGMRAEQVHGGDARGALIRAGVL